jgi:hypothetical protein
MPSSADEQGKGKQKESEQNNGAEFVSRKILEFFSIKLVISILMTQLLNMILLNIKKSGGPKVLP